MDNGSRILLGASGFYTIYTIISRQYSNLYVILTRLTRWLRYLCRWWAQGFRFSQYELPELFKILELCVNIVNIEIGLCGIYLKLKLVTIANTFDFRVAYFSENWKAKQLWSWETVLWVKLKKVRQQLSEARTEEAELLIQSLSLSWLIDSRSNLSQILKGVLTVYKRGILFLQGTDQFNDFYQLIIFTYYILFWCRLELLSLGTWRERKTRLTWEKKALLGQFLRVDSFLCDLKIIILVILTSLLVSHHELSHNASNAPDVYFSSVPRMAEYYLWSSVESRTHLPSLGWIFVTALRSLCHICLIAQSRRWIWLALIYL